VTNDGTSAYAWNEFSKMKSANISGTNCATSGQCLTYDAFGRLVEIDSGSTKTEIWYTQLGKTAYMNGSTYLYSYIPTPGGGAALNVGTTSYYMHKDWLGNARIVSTVPSTGNGSVTTDRAFAPYGEIYNIYGSTNQNYAMFTGDTQDVLSGMWDTPNRELQGSQQGRWLSPDPAGSGWNQYAYVTNPNSQIDQLGLYCQAPIQGRYYPGCPQAVAIGGLSSCVGSCSYNPGEMGTYGLAFMSGSPSSVYGTDGGNVAYGPDGWSQVPGSSGNQDPLHSINAVAAVFLAPLLQSVPWGSLDAIEQAVETQGGSPYSVVSLGDQGSVDDPNGAGVYNVVGYQAMNGGSPVGDVTLTEEITPLATNNANPPVGNSAYSPYTGNFEDDIGVPAPVTANSTGAYMTLQTMDLTVDGVTYFNVGPVNIQVMVMQNGVLVVGQPITIPAVPFQK
jgi:RHS repeat-associated protein